MILVALSTIFILNESLSSTLNESIRSQVHEIENYQLTDKNDLSHYIHLLDSLIEESQKFSDLDTESENSNSQKSLEEYKKALKKLKIMTKKSSHDLGQIQVIKKVFVTRFKKEDKTFWNRTYDFFTSTEGIIISAIVTAGLVGAIWMFWDNISQWFSPTKNNKNVSVEASDEKFVEDDEEEENIYENSESEESNDEKNYVVWTHELVEEAIEQKTLSQLIEKKDKKGRTLFMWATLNLAKEKFKNLLLSEEIQKIVNYRDYDRRTALMLAAKKGIGRRVELLLKNKNIQSGINWYDANGKTPLILGVESNYVDVVKVLLKSNLIKEWIVKQDKEGFTALMRAVKENNKDIVKLILKDKYVTTATLFATNKSGHTVFYMAVIEKNKSLLKLLLEGSSLCRKVEEVQDTLCKKGIHLKDKKGGNTPLMIAAAKGQLDIVQMLIYSRFMNFSQDVVKNHDEKTAFALAAQNGRDRILKELLAWNKFNPYTFYSQDKKGKSPFILAAGNGRLSTVKLLIGYKLMKPFILNQQDKSGHTALILAVKNGYIDIVKLIVGSRHLSDGLDLKDKTGRTAIDWAESRGYKKIAEILHKSAKK